MHRSQSTRSGEVFSRAILPLVLFVAVVGGIAWVTQYLPKGTRATSSTSSSDPGAPANQEPWLHFKMEKAVFDAKDPDYALEVEKDAQLHYDFPFENLSGKDLTLGLNFKSCTCTNIDFKVNDEPFKPMAKNEKDGEAVPAGAHGVIRFNWTAKQNGSQTLTGEVWCQQKDLAKTRRFQKLSATCLVQPPVMFKPDKENVGAITEKTVQFVCWSATRKNIKLEVKKAEPCFVYDIQPMSETETAKLRADLKESKKRVESAFNVKVSIFQEKDGHFLDQGHLNHTATFLVRDPNDAKPVEVTGPTIQGTVAGDVVVGAPEDNGTFRLNYTVGDGINRSMPLYTDPKIELKLDKQHPDEANMKVKLSKNEADSTPERTAWKLEIVTKECSFRGLIPENTFITLQTSQNRRVRIPVVGTATVPR